MCGIAGEVFFQEAELNDHWVRRACGIMRHRGPDGDGFYSGVSGMGVALGHRRLSIIDLSSGAQPMAYADGRYWLTFNGEIYNYRELKAELTTLGCAFTTTSDTEVILAAYATWGADSFRRLNGIFAFGLWDNLAGTLLVARDQLGVKPLLYHHDDTGLRFASELKALLAHPRVQRSVDPKALQDYLGLGYVLAPRTLIQGVYKLPPGSYLQIRNGGVELCPYWNLAEFISPPIPLSTSSEGKCLAVFDQNLRDAVQAQLVSDVPLGAFLSGGIDSSSIVYYAKEKNSAPFKTFSIGFDEASYSELDYAQMAGDHLHTEHHQQVVNAPTMDELGKLVWYYDEPLGDTSIIPTYFVSRLARQHVTVTLSGDGGDELLAGYDTYVADRLQAIYARVPNWIHRGIVQPVANLIPSSYRKVSLDFKIKQFITQAHASAERAHYGWRMMFDDEMRSALAGLSGGYSPFETYARYYDDVPRADPLTRSLYVDIKTWLVDDILTKVDRASMACSLEARVPFLAPRFVEYAMGIPPQLKLKGMTRKVILKQAMRKRLPSQIIDRQKRGFNSPVSIWMRDSWRGTIDDLFRQRASTLVDLGSPVLQTLWQEHASGQVDHGYKLWTLLSLILWEHQILNDRQPT